jgi:hypothetical protein
MRFISSDRLSNRYAVGCTEDLGFVDEVFSYILTKARDQDAATLFYGLASNGLARRPLAKFFKDNYDVVSALSFFSWLISTVGMHPVPQTI